MSIATNAPAGNPFLALSLGWDPRAEHRKRGGCWNIQMCMIVETQFTLHFEEHRYLWNINDWSIKFHMTSHSICKHKTSYSDDDNVGGPKFGSFWPTRIFGWCTQNDSPICGGPECFDSHSYPSIIWCESSCLFLQPHLSSFWNCYKMGNLRWLHQSLTRLK